MSDIWHDLIKPSGRPISLKDIEAFEADIGYTFPDDYRQFLLAYNGGTVVFEHDIPIPDMPGGGVFVKYLWALSVASPSLGVKESRAIQTIYRQCLRQAVIIGDDWGTGYFFLILDGVERGAVYFIYKDGMPQLSEEEWESWEIHIPEDMVKITSDFDSLAELITNNPSD
jgi:SMI1 / KNR4 family (SUKH-1)